jgi:hypothetical protein
MDQFRTHDSRNLFPALWKTTRMSMVARSNPKRPPVCLNEGSKHLLSQSREPLPTQPPRADHAVREDYEHVREGTCIFFMVFAPLPSRRHVAVTERRTARDFAGTIHDICLSPV